MRTGQLTCQQVVDLVTDYLEGALAPGDRRLFEGHLRRCAPCGVYLDQVRATVSALGAVPAEALDPFTCRRLVAAFRSWADRRGG